MTHTSQTLDNYTGIQKQSKAQPKPPPLVTSKNKFELAKVGVDIPASMFKKSRIRRRKISKK